MGLRIQRAAVLGAGVMGSAIAAHLANAGIPVLLLDMVPPQSPGPRNVLALSALERLRKQKPAPLFSPEARGLIEVGNFDDDLERLRGCDWVVEAVKEDLQAKQSLFSRIEPHLGEKTIVSSNTSGLSIEGMLAGRSEGFRRRFLVTHFFNPVRYMKLLEIVEGPQTDPEVIETLTSFGERRLGKGIVRAKDTTNFIANRIGVYAIMKTVEEMNRAGLSIEAVDRIFGPAMGKPKSAIFRTADIVGLDTFVHVAQNCYDTLTADEARETFAVPPFIQAMVEKNLLGEKTGGGFYKKQKGNPEIQVLDWQTFEYRPQQKVRYESLGTAKDIDDVRKRVATVMHGADEAARFAEKVTFEVLAYASRRIPEIGDDVVSVDRAMRWGFGWELGPFELWDAYGAAAGAERMEALGIRPAPWVRDMLASGRSSFYGVEGVATTYWDMAARQVQKVPADPHVITVEVLRRGNRKVDGNESASIWDMGDGVLLLEFHSKMNSIDDGIVSMMNRSLDRAEKDFHALVVGNDGGNFSVGANLMGLLMAIHSEDWDALSRLARSFQQVNLRMRRSPIPVVAAPFGLTLGGGAEVVFGANTVQASAETYIGLVEAGVGLVPGGGGTLGLLRNVYGPFARDRSFDPLPFVSKVFQLIGMAKVSTSAAEAKEMGFLREEDGVSMNRDFLLGDAKARAIGLAASGFMPPPPTSFRLPGASGRATIDMMLYDMELNGQISSHDRTIGRVLARILTGGDTSPDVLLSEERILELELEGFLSLCGEEKTKERLMHMMQTGKPLRN